MKPEMVEAKRNFADAAKMGDCPRTASLVGIDAAAAVLLDAHFQDLVVRRAQEFGAALDFKLPSLAALAESPLRNLWISLPMMHGGFRVTLRRGGISPQVITES